jgi:hypothetical protein
MIRWIFTVFALAIVGCTTNPITLKSPGVHKIGSTYSITTTRGWSHIAGTPSTWTKDGLSVGFFWTWSQLKDGQSLFPNSEKKLPTYRGNSTEIEISEFVADTIEAIVPGSDVQIESFKPIAFGSVEGFRFTIRYDQNGLAKKGLVSGAQRANGLDLIIFLAPKEHYFDYYAPEIEGILQTVKTT